MWHLFTTKVSLFIKLCAGLLWHLSLAWALQIINLLFKAISENSGGGCAAKTYALLKSVRNNLFLKVVLHLTFSFLCYFWTFYSWNHEFII